MLEAGGNPGKIHTLSLTREGFVVDYKGYVAWKSGRPLHQQRCGEWDGKAEWTMIGHSWARLAGQRCLHRLSISHVRGTEKGEPLTRIVVEKVAKSDGIDDLIFLVHGLDGKRDHGGGRLLLCKGRGATLELPTTTTGRVNFVDLRAYGTTSDDKTDVYTDGEIGLAREIDGDKGALGSLAGCVAHDPEQVDA